MLNDALGLLRFKLKNLLFPESLSLKLGLSSPKLPSHPIRASVFQLFIAVEQITQNSALEQWQSFILLMNLERWLGTAGQFWPAVSCGHTHSGAPRPLRGSFAHGLVLRPGRFLQLAVGTAGAPGTSLSLSLLVSLLHMAASGSCTSSAMAEGSWSECPKRDWQKLPSLESHARLH